MEKYSQLDQDTWILNQTNYKKDGFFVEIGAYDGQHLSNTYILEKEYNWSGICAECNPQTIPSLIQNRNCEIETRALFNRNNLNVPFYSGEDPTLAQIFYTESVTDEKTGKILYPQHVVKTVDINTMLEEHNAPTDIDYISIDTEGSELFIVTVFDFAKYNVNYWTIEVNEEEPYHTEALKYLRRFFYYHGYESEMRKWDLFVWKQYD
tara:strand:+ start:22 stop:645 length:624 start_codon:yes stop_codon:yes gene_type:complete